MQQTYMLIQFDSKHLVQSMPLVATPANFYYLDPTTNNQKIKKNKKCFSCILSLNHTMWNPRALRHPCILPPIKEPCYCPRALVQVEAGVMLM